MEIKKQGSLAIVDKVPKGTVPIEFGTVPIKQTEKGTEKQVK
jgi:hypothetical protein